MESLCCTAEIGTILYINSTLIKKKKKKKEEEKSSSLKGPRLKISNVKGGGCLFMGFDLPFFS